MNREDQWEAATEAFAQARAECAQYLLCAVQAADNASMAYGRLKPLEDPQQAMGYISYGLGQMYLILSVINEEGLAANEQEFNQIACDTARLYESLEPNQLIAKP